MNKFPKVSIVTIVYNGAKTLEKTILSVLNQTYSNIEYIVVDGGSKDDSLNIIRRYNDRISRWISEPDRGISDAFNKGIALATGDLIGIINADDWYEPNGVEMIVNNMSDEYDVYCGNITLIGATDDITVNRKSKIDWINLGMYIMHPSVFVRSHVYKQVGNYDVNLKIAMDFDMMLRIKKRHFKFRYIDANIACMRTDGASSDVKKMHREELTVINRHLAGFNYLLSFGFNYLSRLRWRFLYNNPLKAKA